MSHWQHPLRAAREARHWSIDTLSGRTGLSRRTIMRAERGFGLNPDSRRLLCAAFDMSAVQLGLTPRQQPEPPPTLPDAELLGPPDDIGAAVARLRTAYPRTPPLAVLADVEAGLGQVRRLLERKPTGLHLRTILVASAWLHLLAGTARFDLFDRPASRLYRSEAERLAAESGDSELLGWTYETAAHFALVEGEFRDAIQHARAAQHSAPPKSTAALAGHLQEARSWSQLGSSLDAIAALHRASAIFEGQSEAGRPGDHYSFDAQKFGFFAATTYAEVGQTAEAERTARSVIVACAHRPNTAANTRVTLALALAQRGELDEAAHEAASALAGPRVHPDTLRRAREVGRFLAPHGSVSSVQALQARLSAFARQIVNGGMV
jgi:transcriptional regulator with XRE-family HTH domain